MSLNTFLSGTVSAFQRPAWPSVGSQGGSYDNVLTETMNVLYKADLIRRRTPWNTREVVELAT